MRKYIIVLVALVSLFFVACSDDRINPSELVGLVFYYQVPGEVNVYSIEFTDDTSATLYEKSPGFDPTAPAFDPDAPGFDKDDPDDDVFVDSDAITISGLSGTRMFIWSTFSSEAAITEWNVRLNTFESHGTVTFQTKYFYVYP